ncbi:MAG: glycosyltransferase [Flavobacteriales bacterium]|nr:glycosyltransferase [Flavobacteriales bacterium]
MEFSDKPLVSVVVPTYNHGEFIGQCLSSILEQSTDFKFEVLIGDNESSDQTLSVCEEFLDKYPDAVRLYSKKRAEVVYINGVATGRRNVIELISEAKGSYIAICEGDDFWLSRNKLQSQINFLECNPNYAGAYHETFVIDGEKVDPSIKFRTTVPDVVNTELTISDQSIFHTSSFIFRKSSIVDFPEFMWRVVSFDMALFSIVSSTGDLKCIPGIYSVYRKHPGGITNTNGVRDHFHSERIKLLNELNNFHLGIYNTKVQEVISLHEQAIKIQKRQRIKRWFKLGF